MAHKHQSSTNTGSSTDPFTEYELFKAAERSQLNPFIDELFKTGELFKVDERFKDLDGIKLFRRPVKHDFKDTEWLGEPAIKLTRCTDEQIASLGRSVIPMLSSGFSARGIASIFQLAYHLKSPGTTNFRNYVFHSNETLETNEDKPCNEFDDKIDSVHGHFEMIRASTNVTREAAFYSYIAASLFRLFTKPAGNYVRSWFSIINGFSRFYRETVDVRVPVPSEDAVQFFKYRLDLEDMKVTLYRFLYMSNSDGSFLNLKSFLYDDCLSYSGMHIVSILMQLSEVLNCSIGLILDAIKSKEVEEQVECLVRVLEFMDGNDENYRMRMWRYGRVFEQTFMSYLQTKTCPRLVYMLAEALRSEEPEKHKGILQIAQLAGVTEYDKRECVIVAKCLLEILKSHNPSGASSSTFRPYSSKKARKG